MRIITLLSVSLVALIALAAFKYGRTGYESAEYQVQTREGSFEVRVYPDLVLASTPMTDPQGEDGSFMRLFRYIAGSNQAQQNISMTTPVLVRGAERGRMSFVMPREVARSGAPQASDSDVWIETLEGGRYAAYRFSGRWNPGDFGESMEKLLAWVDKRGLKPEGEPFAAGYDPPFTPPFLRRNEVLVRLAD